MLAPASHPARDLQCTFDTGRDSYPAICAGGDGSFVSRARCARASAKLWKPALEPATIQFSSFLLMDVLALLDNGPVLPRIPGISEFIAPAGSCVQDRQEK